jgi:hypothetical protein
MPAGSGKRNQQACYESKLLASARAAVAANSGTLPRVTADGLALHRDSGTDRNVNIKLSLGDFAVRIRPGHRAPQ